MTSFTWLNILPTIVILIPFMFELYAGKDDETYASLRPYIIISYIASVLITFGLVYIRRKKNEQHYQRLLESITRNTKFKK